MQIIQQLLSQALAVVTVHFKYKLSVDGESLDLSLLNKFIIDGLLLRNILLNVYFMSKTQHFAG
jgi:hypothetical protein